MWRIILETFLSDRVFGSQLLSTQNNYTLAREFGSQLFFVSRIGRCDNLSLLRCTAATTSIFVIYNTFHFALYSLAKKTFVSEDIYAFLRDSLELLYIRQVE